MPHSVTRHSILALAILAQLLSGAARAQVSTGTPDRLVDLVEVTAHEEQIDLAVQFNCSMRYVTHLPASEGSEVRIQLLPMGDCGTNPFSQVVPEVPPVSDATGILVSARLESEAPGQVTLLLAFRAVEQFVIAQGTDPHGLRIRLLKQARTHSKVLISQAPDSADNFAVNLESQPKPFDPAAIQLAHERLQLPVFVSETTVGEVKWYRLRVGPIERRADAEQVLNRALRDYPRAWLAQGDDSVTADLGTPGAAPSLPAVGRIGTDPPLEPAVIKRMLTEARAAMGSRNYTKAISLLTQLQRQPEFPDRAYAQELLGLARERAGQLAHAKAEYEEYLRRYPHGEAAERIAARLRILRAASADSRGAGFGSASNAPWQVNGGFGQLFRYDSTRFESGTSTTAGTPNLPNSQQTTSQNALYNDVDALVRHRGESIDLLMRLSAGYTKQFAANAFGDYKRVSLASIELSDRPLGLLARVGRQVRYQDGILGTFDGIFLSYRLHPGWTVNAAAGYPVELTNQSVQTRERFESLALGYAPPGRHWDGSVFAAAQQFDGVRDRRAAGFEARYLTLHSSLIGFVDYDVSFKSLNVAMLLGTLQLPARWIVSFDAERRNSPVLTTRNALIGQPDSSLAQLEQRYTLQEIYQFARDRTPTTDGYAVTATAPLGERFHFATTVAAMRIGATPASGGVNAQPSTGLDLTYQAQLYGTSLWSSGDFNILTLTYGNTEVGKIEALSVSSRFPIGGAWRIGPRLSVDHRSIVTDGSTEVTVLPSLLLDYQRGRRLLQFEVGGQTGKRDAAAQTENTRRYYVSLGYRMGF
jgi:tetratricopeptide (TPR) repeat protein